MAFPIHPPICRNRASTGRVARTRPFAFLGVFLLSLAAPTTGAAIDVRTSGAGSGGRVAVAEGETVNDTLVVFAETVNIDGIVTGDLVVFARQVNVRGSVQGNLIGFAQRIDVSGAVAGDVVGFAEVIELEGRVARQLWTFSQSAVVAGDGAVQGDAVMFGADLDVDGVVGRDVWTLGEQLDVRGQVGRDLRFRGGRLTVRAPAAVGGDVSARVDRQDDVTVEPGALVSGAPSVEVNAPDRSRFASPGFYIGQILRLAAAFLAGVLLFWLFPGARRIVFEDGRSVLASGGVGLLAAVGLPIAALILAVTLIGLPVAFVTLVIWILGLYLAKIIVARWLGGALRTTNPADMSSVALSLLIGLVLILVIVNLPYVGGLLNLLLTLIGFGALLIGVRHAIWRRSGPAPASAGH